MVFNSHLSVTVNGTKVHDKLAGDGHVDTPEKLKKITDAITAAKETTEISKAAK